MSGALIIERQSASLTYNRATSALTVERTQGNAIIIERAAFVEVGTGGPVARFVHIQSVPAAQWIVNHNLGFKPAVTLFSLGGVEIDAHIIHPTPNQFQAFFNTPISGTAQGQ